MHEVSSSNGSSSTDPYYVFPAIRGIQAGREYYCTMCSLNLIPRIFLFDEEDLPAEMRAQRVLNKGRIPSLSRYLTENPKEYIFSSITASIDGDVNFIPYAGEKSNKIGELRIPMSCRIIINDGQHRRAAIEQALKEHQELGQDTISVVFFIDAGLKKSQQMFADLNQHSVRPTKSLGILYDHRDEFARFILRLIDKVPIFKDRIEMEKISISNRSLKFFTLSAVYQANKELLGKLRVQESVSKEDEQLATKFWLSVTEHIPQWKMLIQNKVSTDELRRDYINSHGISLHALGIAGHALIMKHPNDWVSRLSLLENIDWSRSNSKVWEGVATIGGVVSKARTNLVLTSNFIKSTLNLPLDNKDQPLVVISNSKKRKEKIS